MNLKCHRTGKIIHYTRDKATRALKGLSDKTGYEGHVYHCEHCCGWHFGRERKGGHFCIGMLNTEPEWDE